MIVMLDNKPIRFTDDGKLFIIDAITALSGDNNPDALWDTLTEQEPEIKEHIQYQTLPDKQKQPVTDSIGWEIIHQHLLDRMAENQAV